MVGVDILIRGDFFGVWTGIIDGLKHGETGFVSTERRNVIGCAARDIADRPGKR